MNSDYIKKNILEASAWCHIKIDLNRLNECLRTDALMPELDSKNRPIVSTDSVDYVSSRRSAELNKIKTDDNIKKRSPRGRILVFDLDSTFSDGAAEGESNGFFDYTNRPPWDTWIMYVQEIPESEYRRQEPFDAYLLSWVPENMVDIVESAIMVNPEGCIEWADRINSPFMKRVNEILQEIIENEDQ